MSQLFTNNAATTLASGLAAGGTSLTVASGKGALFPSPDYGGAGEYALLTLVRASDGAVEVVLLSSRTADVLSVIRAQEGTTALDFLTGDKVELRITAEYLNRSGPKTTFHNVTASRTMGVTYTNTKPHDIFVICSATSTADHAIAVMTVSVGSFAGSSASVAYQDLAQVSTIIGPGGTYVFTLSAGTPTLYSWWERY